MSATTAQVEYTESELLANCDVTEPLIAGGRVCHGGFDSTGTYVSPRTKYRAPAIEAWRAHHVATFDQPILHVPLDTWPAHYPNVAQARFLIEAGVPEPLMATLTRIGTVEGFGANIRYLQPGDLQPRFDEDLAGTATSHLGKGLFEAHGRDEAGWEEEAGHKDMWFAARDIAFEGRTAKVDIDAMLERMGFGNGGGGGGAAKPRQLPDVIDPNLEAIADLMIRVLLIEVQAFHTFAWAEEWLSDRELVAGEGAAADLVSHIRADETPHVGYLATAITEMRDRTWIGTDGSKHAGTDMIGRLWDRNLDSSLGAGRVASRRAVVDEVAFWCNKRPDGKDLLARFHSLGDPDALVDLAGAAPAPGTAPQGY
jgi:hypothetical protein